MQGRSLRKLHLSLEADCNLCLRDTSQENWIRVICDLADVCFHYRTDKLSILHAIWVRRGFCRVGAVGEGYPGVLWG